MWLKILIATALVLVIIFIPAARWHAATFFAKFCVTCAFQYFSKTAMIANNEAARIAVNDVVDDVVDDALVTIGAGKSRVSRLPTRENFTEADLRLWCDANSDIFAGGSRGEALCRAAIAKIWHQTYNDDNLLILRAAKPDWLRYVSKTGSAIRLEIDGLDTDTRQFNKRNVQLAFEYDGPQHSSFQKFCEMVGKPESSWLALDYYRQRFYDRLKDDLCREHRVTLIRVENADYSNILHAVYAALAREWLGQSARETEVLVDDKHVIDALYKADGFDLRRSENYAALQFPGVASLPVASRDWTPHPYNDPSSLYSRLFAADLTKFTNAVVEKYSQIKYNRSDARELTRYLQTSTTSAMRALEPLVIEEQHRAIGKALSRMTKTIVKRTCTI